MKIDEEGIRFSVSGKVFYNPAMRLCRSISSLAVGAIGEKIEVVDAFCASGIRGIRYAKENRNVSKLTSIDIEKSAIALARKNAKSNRVRSASGVVGNISRLAFEYDADFLEIDPFGTPSPYLLDSFRFFNTKKSAYLSVTATDVAVLCGGKLAPCLKNYHSRPMNNEFTHETGLRIMLKRIAETAAEFNMGIRPLFSISDKHYLKTIVAVQRSADMAFDSMKKLGFTYYCKHCGFRGATSNRAGAQSANDAVGTLPEAAAAKEGKDPGQPSPFPPMYCPDCALGNNPGRKLEFAGALWLGELHEAEFIRKMAVLNQSRGYADREELERMLSMMENEVGMPPYYYNVHEICALGRLKSVPTMDSVMKALGAAGYRAFRTHFSPVSIKTDAPYPKIREAAGWEGR